MLKEKLKPRLKQNHRRENVVKLLKGKHKWWLNED
jgi:hypothetical protein